MLKSISKIAQVLMIASSLSIQAQLFIEPNTFTGFDNEITGVYEGSVAFSDVNGDGKQDLLISGYAYGNPLVRTTKLYTNSGTNFIEVIGTPFEAVEASSIAFSDVNSDGKPDVLITGYNNNGDLIAKLYSNSGTNFTEVVGTPFEGVRYGSVAFSDVNSDGKPDVLITGENSQNNPIAKLYTNSGINFTLINTPISGVREGSIAFSDVNNDGNPDLFISGKSSSNIPLVELYTNSGSNFSLVIGTPFIGVTSSSIAVSDVNSDGKPDLLISGDSTTIPSLSVNLKPITRLYTNSGINFSQINSPIKNVQNGSSVFSDVNFDGKPDLMITGLDSNNVPQSILYTNSGSNFDEVQNTPFEGVSLSSIAFSDVNNDGKLDLLISGSTNSTYISNLYLNTKVKPTVIVSQPSNATVCSGLVQITVSATGDNLSYLWSNNATTSSINTSLPGTYFVTVTGDGGIVISNEVEIFSCTTLAGIKNLNDGQQNFSIYPNPSNGSFEIEINSSLEAFEIVSMDGRILSSGNLVRGKNKIDTYNTKGIHFIKIGNYVSKLVIE